MSDTETSKTGRKPNTQPNGFLPSLPVEIFLGDEALGAIQVQQDALLSKKGNVLYHARITRGWVLPDGALDILAFKVNGVDAVRSAKGVHLSAPRVRAATGQVIPGTGGEPLVAHTAILNASVDDEVDYMVNIFVKRLREKAGKDQGHSLRIQGMPKAVGVPGQQIVAGDITGLAIV